MEESRCVACDALIFEPHGEVRPPCPVCGSLGRKFLAKIEDNIVFYDGTRTKGYKADSTKFYVDMRCGPSYYRKGDQWHHLVRIVDRENDRYVETIRVLSTGELISHVEEPLSRHTGHGGSKNQGDASEP